MYIHRLHKLASFRKRCQFHILNDQKTCYILCALGRKLCLLNLILQSNGSSHPIVCDLILYRIRSCHLILCNKDFLCIIELENSQVNLPLFSRPYSERSSTIGRQYPNTYRYQFSLLYCLQFLFSSRYFSAASCIPLLFKSHR